MIQYTVSDEAAIHIRVDDRKLYKLTGPADIEAAAYRISETETGIKLQKP
jgi:hypothetical protein